MNSWEDQLLAYAAMVLILLFAILMYIDLFK